MTLTAHATVIPVIVVVIRTGLPYGSGNRRGQGKGAKT